MTKALSELEKLEKKLMALKAERKELFALQEPIKAKLSSTYRAVEKVKDKIAVCLLAAEGPTNWAFLLDVDSGTAAYNAAEEELSVWGLDVDCYLPSTGQRVVRVSMTRGDKVSYDKALAGLREVLPFIKPLPEDPDSVRGDFDRAGYKYVSIFESTLSEDGSYYTLINEEKNDYRLMQDRYHSTYTLEKFPTLEELLKYVQVHHWYRDKGEL